jgi:DNA topoisomerase-1
MTVVTRIRATGILRLGTVRSGFRYRDSRGGKPGRRQLERIRRLSIPPAWREVAINQSAEGNVQAVGQDKAGRWQYLYHQRAVARRERLKLHRLAAFMRSLPRLREKVARDLRRQEIDRERVLACIVRILTMCFLRSEARSTQRERQLWNRDAAPQARPRSRQPDSARSPARVQGSRLELTDRGVARVVRALLALPGRRLFKAPGQDGK